jgi:hypothetical protein
MLCEEASASLIAKCVAVGLCYYVLFVLNNYGALCVCVCVRVLTGDHECVTFL